MTRRSRTVRRPEPTDQQQREARDRELARHTREQEAFARRRAQTPLPYASTLARLTCFCQRVLETKPEVIECECGRRWEAVDAPRPSPFHR